MGSWLIQLRRIHLRGWRAAPLALASAVGGITIGTALVVATQLLTASLSAPFDSLPARAGALGELIEVRPVVADRLGDRLVDSLSRVSGVDGVARLAVQPSVHGGPTLRLALRADPSVLPALTEASLGEARVDPVADPATLNGSNAAGEPYWSVAYVRPASAVDRDRVVAALASALGDRAEVGDPAPVIPPSIVTVRDALSSLAAGGVFIGALIAINTLVLVIGARVPTYATAAVLGLTRRRVLGGVALEGAAIGLIGGMLAIPVGLGLGAVLVDRFGESILAGSGVDLHLVVAPIALLGAPSTGALLGAAATVLAARRPLRRPLDQLGGVVDRTRPAALPGWIAPVGAALITVATGLMAAVGSGRVTVKASQVALVWGALGLAAVGVWAVPRAALAVTAALDGRSPAPARLVAAEVRRVPMRLAVVVSTLGLAAGMAAAFAGLAELAPSTLADSFEHRLGAGGRLVAAARPWDPRFASLAPPGAEGAAPEGQPRWRALLPSATEPRLIIALDAEPTSVAVHVRADDPTSVAAALADGQVALTSIAAHRLGVGVGDVVEVPAIDGPASVRVAAVVEVGLADDSTIGDWVVVAHDAATQRRWAPSLELVATDAMTAPAPAPAAAAGAHRYDRAGYRRATADGIGRYFHPFALTGWIYLAAAIVAAGNFLLLGVLARARERATLVVLGADVATDRRAVVWQALITAALALAMYLVSVVAFTGWLALSSRAFYGFQLQPALSLRATLVGAGVLLDGVLLASIRPWLATTVPDAGPALRAE